MRKNGGLEWRPKGSPEPVRVHDAEGPGERQGDSLWHLSAWRPKRAGCRSASTMTRPSLRSTLSALGGSTSAGSATRTPARLAVTADCGGANGYRRRRWKVEVQRLADETGLAIQVCHFPPGKSQVEHDRASAVLLHHQQLARHTAHRACDDRQPDRLHSPPAAAGRSVSTRRGQLPRQGHGLTCRAGSRRPAG
jgi:hypothetical protein